MSPWSRVKVYLIIICLQMLQLERLFFRQCFKEPQAQKRCFRGGGKIRRWSCGPQHLLLKEQLLYLLFKLGLKEVNSVKRGLSFPRVISGNFGKVIITNVDPYWSLPFPF